MADKKIRHLCDDGFRRVPLNLEDEPFHLTLDTGRRSFGRGLMCHQLETYLHQNRRREGQQKPVKKIVAEPALPAAPPRAADL